jgi:hypothetical protein
MGDKALCCHTCLWAVHVVSSRCDDGQLVAHVHNKTTTQQYRVNICWWRTWCGPYTLLPRLMMMGSLYRMHRTQHNPDNNTTRRSISSKNPHRTLLSQLVWAVHVSSRDDDGQLVAGHVGLAHHLACCFTKHNNSMAHAAAAQHMVMVVCYLN